jgi:hypothetical protein
MKSLIKIKYKAFFPDSCLANSKIGYKETNNLLRSFLLNNFNYNKTNDKNNLYKFPIKKEYSTHIRSSLKRKSTLLSKRPISPKSNDIKILIKNLCHDNYTSYNYIDNTRGALSSSDIKNKRNRALQKNNYYNNDNKYNEQISTNNNNNDILSFDTNLKTSRNKNSQLADGLFKINRQRNRKHNTIIGNNRNANISFSNYILLMRDNKSNGTSASGASSATNNKGKRHSLKLISDPILLYNSIINKKANKNKSAFFINSNNDSDSKNRNRKSLKINNTDFFFSKKYLNYSPINYNKIQKKFHQKIYLRNLNSQIQKFEESHRYFPNEDLIKLNKNLPSKFQRNLFSMQIKRASKFNDFFVKKFPFKFEKLKKISNKKPKHISHQNLCSSEKLKSLLKNVEKVNKKMKISKKYLKNLDVRLRTKNLNKIFNFVIPHENNVKDFDEEFKDETVKYHKNMGEFFFYKGNGIFSGHLSHLLRGDKLMQQVFKLENI